MATTTCISANPTKNDGGTILNGGNIAGTRFSNLTQSTANTQHNPETAKSVQSATANIGTGKPFAGAVFNSQKAGQYVGPLVQAYIAQSGFTGMRSPAASNHPSRIEQNLYQQYERYDNTTWTYQGVLTKGGNAGTAVLASGINGTTGRTADDAPKTPGELQFMYGALSPKQADYGK